jgi:hypothetical protein
MAGTTLALGLRWLTLQLGPRGQARLLGLARPFARGEARAQLGEIREILRGEQPGPGLVRAMLEGTTHDEIEDLVWGGLVLDQDRRPAGPLAIGRLTMSRSRLFVDSDVDPNAALTARLTQVVALMGPIVELSVQAPRSEPPCTLLVSWKHRGGRYGVLELTRTAHAALRDDALELTGSAGLAWRFGGDELPRQGPRVRVQRGGRLHEFPTDEGFVPKSEPAHAAHAAAVSEAVLAHPGDGRRILLAEPGASR